MMGMEELYLAYRRDVFRYLVSLTHDPALAEDLTSETFLGALQGLPSFRGDSPAKTWLLGIARNRWLKALRRGRKESPAPLLEHYLSETAEEQYLTQEAVRRARELLAQRGDPRAAGILEMRVQGWPYGEIAKRWNLSESSARVVDFRTKKWLRAMLEQEGLL